jgi:hypothetical protein
VLRPPRAFAGERPQAGPLLAMLVASALVGFLLALLTGGGAGAGRVETTIALRGLDEQAPAGAASGTGAEAPVDEGWRQALQRAIAAAERFGGSAQAGVWVEGWPAPLVAGDVLRATNMWSMSKAVTAIAVLEAVPEGPSAELAQALEGALVRSENCAQRRVVLGLQVLRKGAEAARGAFEGVLLRAGAQVRPPVQIAGPEPECVPYLREHAQGLDDPLQEAYLYGTARWTVEDAVRFAHALGTGAYGAAGARVRSLLSRPKGVSSEIEAGGFTADPAWGAGRAFAAWPVAYKAGWGGASSERPAFAIGQIAIVTLRESSVAIAAMFQPATQPPSDDPGAGAGADAVEALLRQLALKLSEPGAAG